MKIAIASDLHLEFGFLEDHIVEEAAQEAKILVLAGDIDTHRHMRRQDLATLDFFKMVNEKFETVLYVLGNHDHYDGLFNDTAMYVQKMIDDNDLNNIFLLNRGIKYIDGVKFIGATMWTDYNNRDWFAMHKAKNQMNDHRCIKFKVGEKYRKWMPEDAAIEHDKDVNFIKSELAKVDDDTETVVITHHLPTQACIPEKFRDAKWRDLNGAYANNLETLIDVLAPTLWIHGHTHDAVDMMCSKTRIVCNPRGYKTHQNTENYQFKIVEI